MPELHLGVCGCDDAGVLGLRYIVAASALAAARVFSRILSLEYRSMSRWPRGLKLAYCIPVVYIIFAATMSQTSVSSLPQTFGISLTKFSGGNGRRGSFRTSSTPFSPSQNHHKATMPTSYAPTSKNTGRKHSETTPGHSQPQSKTSHPQAST